MVHLHLEECDNCYELPPLGQLPCLKQLSVVNMSKVTKVGEEIYGSCSGTYQPFPSLERLGFRDMSSLVEWHIPGLGEFHKLRQLEMINCPKLVGSLPGDIASIDILECPSLKASVPTWPSSSSSVAADADFFEEDMLLRGSPMIEINWKGIMHDHLVRLEISDLPCLNVLTSELCMLQRLKHLNINKCPNLVSLSNTGLPPMLERLYISECDLLQRVVDGMVSPNTCGSFWNLRISLCPSLVSFADNGLPPSLNYVTFCACPKLELHVPEDIESCRSWVECVSLYGCLAPNLAMLPKLFPNLQKLYIGADDTNMECFLQQGEGLPNLTSITIRECKNLKSLPEGMPDLLPSLERLEFEDCPEMESFGEAGLPSSFVKPFIIKCEKLVSGLCLRRLAYLKHLEIIDVGESVVSFPAEGLLPSTLTVLVMAGFPNMKTLNWSGIQNLTSLQKLYIVDCPKLESLPVEGLPPSIRQLVIHRCPLLEPRCEKDRGEDWGKIAHIPNFKPRLSSRDNSWALMERFFDSSPARPTGLLP